MGEKNGIHSSTDGDNSKTRVKVSEEMGKWAKLEFDLEESSSDLCLFPAKHHRPERAGCVDRAAYHLHADE